MLPLTGLIHFPLQPLRSDISKMCDPNSDQQHVREARQLYGTILAPNDANPLCDAIKKKNQQQLK